MKNKSKTGIIIVLILLILNVIGLAVGIELVEQLNFIILYLLHFLMIVGGIKALLKE